MKSWMSTVSLWVLISSIVFGMTNASFALEEKTPLLNHQAGEATSGSPMASGQASGQSSGKIHHNISHTSQSAGSEEASEEELRRAIQEDQHNVNCLLGIYCIGLSILEGLLPCM